MYEIYILNANDDIIIEITKLFVLQLERLFLLFVLHIKFI